MKTLSKLVMLLALLALCLPAHGEILIYNKTMKCFEADGYWDGEDPWDWDIDDGMGRGYLVIEVDFVDGEIDEIYGATQVEYWRDGRDKYYLEDYHEFSVERIEIEDRWGRTIVYWVLEDIYTPDGQLFAIMVRGKARLMNIGLGWDERREIAPALEGAILEYEEWTDEPEVWIWKRICCVTYRLHPWWTRLANLYEPGPGDPDPFEYALWEIVEDWLEWLGYDYVKI